MYEWFEQFRCYIAQHKNLKLLHCKNGSNHKNNFNNLMLQWTAKNHTAKVWNWYRSNCKTFFKRQIIQLQTCKSQFAHDETIINKDNFKLLHCKNGSNHKNDLNNLDAMYITPHKNHTTKLWNWYCLNCKTRKKIHPCSNNNKHGQFEMVTL